MRNLIVIVIAYIIAATMSVEAIPANCSKTYKVVSGDSTTTTIKKTSTTTKKSTSTSSTTVPISTNLVYNYGLTVQVSSKTDFCLFLPSSPGGKDDNNDKADAEAISKSEKNAVSFCLKNNAKAPGARTLPVTFIETSYFFENTTAGYVQVTGNFKPAAWELSTQDGGGQYDNHGKGSPPNSMCYGYKYYVGLIEPDGGHYCMRCCDHYADCNAGRSTYGCKRVVDNGVYL
ncbi:hypothetical protein BD408DRAFT_406771 [Parasitella parasitica]|nr:hypothetical protein BD408DRAFT_406771 [Parasitella parasitica]